LLFDTRFVSLTSASVVDIGKQPEKRVFDAVRESKKTRPRHANGGAWLKPTKLDGRDQRPMNSHNKRIIGIGTPSIQSRIPRPIMIS
jgi:hypothetical protein